VAIALRTYLASLKSQYYIMHQSVHYFKCSQTVAAGRSRVSTVEQKIFQINTGFLYMIVVAD